MGKKTKAAVEGAKRVPSKEEFQERPSSKTFLYRKSKPNNEETRHAPELPGRGDGPSAIIVGGGGGGGDVTTPGGGGSGGRPGLSIIPAPVPVPVPIEGSARA